MCHRERERWTRPGITEDQRVREREKEREIERYTDTSETVRGRGYELVDWLVIGF